MPAPFGPVLRDLQGAAHLAAEATVGATDLVEAVHAQLGRRAMTRPGGRRRGISGLVYRIVRGVARATGRAADVPLALLAARAASEAASAPPSARRDALVAALNGVLGDHLAEGLNPLATEMTLRRGGLALPLDPPALARALPQPSPDILVLAHGLCLNSAGWRWKGHSHGEALERDLGLTAVYLDYNTGRHISTNGQASALLLDRLVGAWPVPVRSVTVVAHSMGGLVTRSAIAAAQQGGLAWPGLLTRIVFLGTPHHGSPLERGGNGVDRLLLRHRVTAPFARLGHLRSAGITDLREGSLSDADWQGTDRFARSLTPPAAVPLPEGVACYALAATAGRRPRALLGRAVGDGLVPLASALGRHPAPGRDLAIPPERQRVLPGLHHFDLLGAEAYGPIRDWLAEGLEGCEV